MLGTKQLEVMTDFYKKVLGKDPDMTEEGWSGFSAGSTYFMIGDHSEMKGMTKDPARVMFNFETADVKGEFDRLITVGAKEIKAPYEMEGAWIATLADPDGNYFQLMSPWEEK